jgi:dTDP-4-dehydrorhamnose reductase
MLLVITGTTGRVGRALADRLKGEHQIVEMPRALMDLGDPEAAIRALRDIPFDALLNPAGMTRLEACEDFPELARRTNALSPAALARFCREEGARMIHFSTDYVFDGKEPGLKMETNAMAPLSLYGMTKRDGEQAVLAEGGTVLRVSWVFGPERPAFPDTFLADALAGKPLAAVADKFSLPTYTTDLAGWVADLLRHPDSPGLYHACNGGEPTSWHGMAQEIVAFLGGEGLIDPATPVRHLSIEELPALRAPRPIHTAMATEKIAALLGRPPRDWREALHNYLRVCLDLE